MCQDDGQEGPMVGHPVLSKSMKGVRRLRPAIVKSKADHSGRWLILLIDVNVVPFILGNIYATNNS